MAVVWVDGVAENHFVVGQTVAAVDGDIAVEGNGHLGYEDHRPSRRYESLDAVMSETFEGGNGALQHLMGAVAEQCAVNVEKNCLDHVYGWCFFKFF